MAVSLMPHLWYTTQAEEAAHFYAGIIPDSRVESVTALPAETPSGPPGTVKIVAMTLAGAPVLAISAGEFEPFTHAISLILACDTQAEIDRIWNGLATGGTPQQCGWLRDRYGLSWQVVPRRLGELIGGTDRASAARVATLMLTMGKIDLAAIEAA